ncbi:hypothetical protein KFU94_29900 [Chloroflexi bacterium TSY]|nr:hypothetical protein [Chloroflexi bacterium TSY]
MFPEKELIELEQKIDPQLKTLLLAAIALSLTIWDLAFNLGAFGTIFFSEFFWVWVTATVTLLVIFLRLWDKSLIRWWGVLMLASPTIILILESLLTIVGGVDEADNLISIITLLVAVVCLPYTVYIVSIITNESLLEIRNREYQRSLVMIAVVIALVGFWVGRFNYLVLTCDDFKVSGNDLPANCRQAEMTVLPIGFVDALRP